MPYQKGFPAWATNQVMLVVIPAVSSPVGPDMCQQVCIYEVEWSMQCAAIVVSLGSHWIQHCKPMLLLSVTLSHARKNKGLALTQKAHLLCRASFPLEEIKVISLKGVAALKSALSRGLCSAQKTFPGLA